MSEMDMPANELLSELVKYDKEDKAIHFLIHLDKPKRQLIKKHLKDFKWVYEFDQETFMNQQGYMAYKPIPKGTDSQRKILGLAHFVCSDQKTFEKEWSNRRNMNMDLLRQVLPSYCPSWFSKCINDALITGNSWSWLSYYELIELEELGYCELLPEGIVLSLASTINANRSEFDPDKNYKMLLEKPITIDKHLWYLFRFETPINWSDNYSYNANRFGLSWSEIFLRLSQEKKIDRSRVMHECLLASNRNFNKVLSGWFIDLFLKFEPQTEELLAIQDTIHNCLNSPQSKVVNASLKMIKSLVKEKKYDHLAFIDMTPVLLNAEVKSVIQSTLLILEKIAAKDKALQNEIACAVCSAFHLQDGNIQSKAAKLIEKYGDPKSDQLKDELNIYTEVIMTDAKHILSNYLIKEEIAVQNEPLEESFEEEKNEIKLPENMDDLIFLASRAFDNVDHNDLEILMASLVTFHKEIITGDLNQFGPAVQKALKVIFSDWNSRMGWLEHLFANFFLSFMNSRAKEVTDGSKKNIVVGLINEYVAADKKKAEEIRFYKTKPISLDTWKASNSGNDSYRVFKEVCFLASTDQVLQKQLPILSTPTHEPSWLHPNTLLNRLAIYKLHNIQVNSFDLQFAIARLDLKVKDIDHQLIKNIYPSLQPIFLFLFGKEHNPTPNAELDMVWRTAVTARSEDNFNDTFASFPSSWFNPNYLTGTFKWSIIKEDYMRKVYDNKLGFVDKPDTRFVLKFDKQKEYLEKEDDRGFISKLIKPTKKLPEKIGWNFYFHSGFVHQNFGLGVQKNDVQRMLYASPNSVGRLIFSIVKNTLMFADLNGENDKRVVNNALNALCELPFRKNGLEQDFVGMSLMCSDKESRFVAVEVWNRIVISDQVNNDIIGSSIAKMTYLNFASLKRFTDLLPTMITYSNAHKKSLMEILESCILQMDNTPVNNTKKLLETYYELTSGRSDYQINDQVLSKLELWQKNSSGLKAIISKLEN